MLNTQEIVEIIVRDGQGNDHPPNLSALLDEPIIDGHQANREESDHSNKSQDELELLTNLE